MRAPPPRAVACRSHLSQGSCCSSATRSARRRSCCSRARGPPSVAALPVLTPRPRAQGCWSTAACACRSWSNEPPCAPPPAALSPPRLTSACAGKVHVQRGSVPARAGGSLRRTRGRPLPGARPAHLALAAACSPAPGRRRGSPPAARRARMSCRRAPTPLPTHPLLLTPTLQTAAQATTVARGRGGARAAAAPGAAVEIAAQRASQETDRFRLPASLAERLCSSGVTIPYEAGSRKRQRLADPGGAPAAARVALSARPLPPHPSLCEDGGCPSPVRSRPPALRGRRRGGRGQLCEPG